MLHTGALIRIKPQKGCHMPNGKILAFEQTLGKFLVEFDVPYYGLNFTLLARNQFNIIKSCKPNIICK